MKIKIKIIVSVALLSILITGTITAQIGRPFIHDPSSIVECEGKYYTFGTGGGGLISEDGWTWNSGAERPGRGAAPDAIKIGNRYLVIYGATGGGFGHGRNGRILTMWNNTLDPKSPDFKYSEAVEVASTFSDTEDCDAIDPGVLLDPTDGRLWLVYGTYYGFTRLVELDPKTGNRVEGNEAIDVASACEGSTLMYHDGWYYLLGTHGTCCDGANSRYNIVAGRSRKVTGPYLDNFGRDMVRGGGKLVAASRGRVIGPGHFGLLDLGDGVQKMSCHYEADLDQGGRSILGIRPLLWKDGWPVAGENFKEGTYEIESHRRGYALELVVDFVRMERGRAPGGQAPGAPAAGAPAAGAPAAGAPQGRAPGAPAPQGRAPGAPAPGAPGAPAGRPADEPIVPVQGQQLADIINTWPAGNIGVRNGEYMIRPHQKWTITAVPDAGGYPGGPYYKIVIEGTGRALAATAEAEVITVPTFTGSPEQLWRIDQLTDGTYRIMPKAIPGSQEKLALVSLGDRTPTLAKFDMNSDNSKWNIKTP